MRSTATVLASMAACAGVVDLWAVTSLGGAFAGVVTGNLVTVGRAVGSFSPADLVAPLVAVVGFAVGVALWSFSGRLSVRSSLLVELAVLVALAVALPLSVPAPILLALASIAMGGQSRIALRLGESTTYLTGTLTGAVAALVVDGRGRWGAVRQLGALVVGATAAAVLLDALWWAVPILAVLALVVAVLVQASGEKRQQDQERERDDHGACDGADGGPEEGQPLR